MVMLHAASTAAGTLSSTLLFALLALGLATSVLASHWSWRPRCHHPGRSPRPAQPGLDGAVALPVSGFQVAHGPNSRAPGWEWVRRCGDSGSLRRISVTLNQEFVLHFNHASERACHAMKRCLPTPASPAPARMPPLMSVPTAATAKKDLCGWQPVRIENPHMHVNLKLS